MPRFTGALAMFILLGAGCPSPNEGEKEQTPVLACGAPIKPDASTCGNGLFDAGEMCISEITQKIDFPPLKSYLPTRNLAVGDFNGDGLTDIVVGIGILENLGEGKLSEKTARGVGRGHTVDLAVADLNGDKIDDILTAEHEHDHEVLGAPADFNLVAIAYGAAEWKFTDDSIKVLPGWLERVTSGDLNTDGLGDIIVSFRSSDIASCGAPIFLRSGDTWTEQVKQPLVRGEGVPCSLFLGKIDDDDTLDFDLTGVERLALGVGDGSFAFTSSPGRPDPMHAEYGWDIDCDAHRDVVGLIASTNVLKGWHGDGAGKFSPFPEELASGVHHMVVADVNADGEPDLVVAGETSIDILLGDVDSLFTSVKHLTQASKESEFTLVDLNGDGALDLVFLDEGTLFVAMNHI